MPVLRSAGEAEALCAQLNKEGLVDAYITIDSDAFLFGADCVIKYLRPNSKVSARSLVVFQSFLLASCFLPPIYVYIVLLWNYHGLHFGNLCILLCRNHLNATICLISKLVLA